MCIYLITIISGILIFVSGQMILKFFIEPIQSFRLTLSHVSLSLLNDYDSFQNSGVLSKDEVFRADKNIRELSARLHSEMIYIPFYEKIYHVFRLPKKADVTESSNKLFKLSNHIYSKVPYKNDQISLYIIEINNLLKLSLPNKGNISEQELKDNIQALKNATKN